MTLAECLQNELQPHIEKGLTKLAKATINYVHLNFKEQGRPEKWIPTTRIAKQNRVSYKKLPSKTGKVGKKGLTQEQSRYLYSAPTLIDTGAMRDGVQPSAISESNGHFSLFIQSDKDYQEAAELGGVLSIKSGSYKVPARPFLHVVEADDMEMPFIGGFNG